MALSVRRWPIMFLRRQEVLIPLHALRQTVGLM